MRIGLFITFFNEQANFVNKSILMKRFYYFWILLFFFCNCEDEKTDFLSLSHEKLVYPWAENIQEIILEADVDWRITSLLPPWLTINVRSSENNQTSLLVAVSDNNTGNLRSSIVTFATANVEKQLLIIQKAKEKLNFSGEKKFRVPPSRINLSLELEQNIGYELIILSESNIWIKQIEANGSVDNFPLSITNDDHAIDVEKEVVGFQSANPLILEILENRTSEERTAKVVVYNKIYNLSDTICITQEAQQKVDNYYDGEYVQFQKAAKGDGGVTLIFMGDGFTSNDLAQNGRYENIMKQAIEYFFSIEPYQSYRDFFNIYMLVAESEEEGVSTSNIFGERVNNKFSTTFGDGTAITCNDDLVFEYARKIKELPSNKPLTIIMPLNSKKYAGTTYLYSNGNSIALCPMSSEAPPNDFEGLIHHEAGGHGFGFLCDEYVYYKTKMPDNRKNDLREWQKLGFQCNLDFTDDLSSILWKDFIGIDKYAHVGAYEGGYEYQYGVWRSESNSCMNSNIPYYNVQSRWSIVSRIMKLAGIDFTVQDFIEADHSTSWSSSTRGVILEKQLPPLGSPKLIK